MKKLFTTLTILIMIAIVAISANASLLVDGDKITFGNENTKSSNPNDDAESYVTLSVPITNNGTSDVTISSIEYSELFGFSRSLINISLISSVTIPAGSYANVELRARIPQTLNAIDTDFIAKSFKVSELTFKGIGTEDKKISVFMQRKNELKIKKMTFDYTDNTEKIRDGKKIDNVKAGDTISVETELENTFSSSADVDIDDVELIFSEDTDLDVDESNDVGSISADDYTTETTSFDVDQSIDQGTYDLKITVEGFDDYNARHGVKWTVPVKVDKENNEISIDKISVNPDTLSCESSLATITVTVDNTGKKNQKETAIEVSALELDFKKKISNIDLDSDDSVTKSFDLSVPANAKPGVYSIRINTYYNNIDLSDERTATLTVKDCNPTPVKETKTDNTNNDLSEDEQDVLVQRQEYIFPKVQDQPVQEETATQGLSFDYVTLLIVLGVVVAGGVIFAIGAIMVSMRKNRY